MYRIRGKIQGVVPILFNRFTEEAKEGMELGTGGGKFTAEQRMTEARGKAHRDNGMVVWPAWNFKKSLLEGCTRAKLKEGRGSATPYLSATVFVDVSPSFGVTEPDFIDERWGRRPPRTGGACMIRRPGMNAGWELPFVLNVTDDRRSPDLIRRALEEAGLLVGMGSFRPEYGRFIVTEWAVEQ